MNVSAQVQLIKETFFIEEYESKALSATEGSYDTYKTFLEFNKQQDRDNPTGSRVSKKLMFDARNMAMLDLVQYAIMQTFQAAIKRDETIRTTDNISQQDVVKGISDARQIIGPLVNNPIFSVADQELMSTAVNNYVRFHNEYETGLSVQAMLQSIFDTLGDDFSFDKVLGNIYITGDFRTVRDNIRESRKFTTNFLSTFFTPNTPTFDSNQNAVQSTCIYHGSCASPVGGH